MPHLPQEIVDYIIDILHDNPEVLKRCCLVSKSWIPRPQTHLFNHVEFKDPEHLSVWRKIFPNPEDSPAVYTRSLCFHNAENIAEGDVNWVRSFTRVERLEVLVHHHEQRPRSRGFFVPFHNLSSTVKSLSVGWSVLPLQQVFDFICSFPLLEDLHVVGLGRDIDGAIFWSARLPVLTGTLVLESAAADFVRQLLELPDSLCFRKVVWRLGIGNEVEWRLGIGNDPEWMRDLVGRCSETLEFIDIHCPDGQVDLSKATKLKEAEFWFNRYNAHQVAQTLHTITSKHEDFKQVSIHLPFSPPDTARLSNATWAADEKIRLQWKSLDHILVRLLESRLTCVKAIWYDHRGEVKVTHEEVKRLLKRLLPKMMMKGGIELEHGKRSKLPVLHSGLKSIIM